MTPEDYGTAYIAGPMTGYPDFNYPAFKSAADELSHAGWTVRHTAHGAAPSPRDAHPWQYYLKRAISTLMECDCVIALPGWQDSRGARLETRIASQVGMPILDFATLTPIAPTTEGAHT